MRCPDERPSSHCAVHGRDRRPEGARSRGRLEHLKPGAGSLAYTLDSRWRNRERFLAGRDDMVAFLHQKWARELEYRLVKEVWAYGDNRIAVRFAYESHNVEGQWFRSHGNENWEFDEHGLMRARHASINDIAIDRTDRLSVGTDQNLDPQMIPT